MVCGSSIVCYHCGILNILCQVKLLKIILDIVLSHAKVLYVDKMTYSNTPTRYLLNLIDWICGFFRHRMNYFI